MAKKSICLQYRCKFCFSAYFDPQLIESKEGEDTDTELDGWNYFLPSRKKPVHAVHWWNASSLWWVYSWGKRRKDPDWTGLLVKLLVRSEVHPTYTSTFKRKQRMYVSLYVLVFYRLIVYAYSYACHSVCVVRGQPAGTEGESFLLSCGSWGSISGPHAWWQMLLPPKPPHRPSVRC